MSLSDRTRQTIVDIAVELFERDGYERTTVVNIAATAEIGTRTPFSYFASKEELLFPENDTWSDSVGDLGCSGSLALPLPAFPGQVPCIEVELKCCEWSRVVAG
ncbi:TetR/AcrR family transcriptional regulator [Streptomyces sp. NPDC059534]|uniref:TetR/AcrR family transcriptional regulator n=1 Tax=Streptomyces sp. NPDC059534 TaxID=3346859 RepID=UPI0036D044AB